MQKPIDRDIVRHVAGLARIELTPDEEARMERDLGDILAHFAELQKVPTDTDTQDVRAEASRNVFRTDDERENTGRGAGTDAFPESDKGFLKIPPVFE